MENSNPYKSPPENFDSLECVNYGQRVGKFLFMLAGCAVALMIFIPRMTGELYFDISPVFNVWAGTKLFRKSNAVRLVVVSIYSFAAIILMLMIVMLLSMPNAEFRIGATLVPNQPFIVIPILLALMFASLYPVVALTSKVAREQFLENKGRLKLK